MSLEQEVELIRQVQIFSKIQPAMQKLLCFSAERLKYDTGQVMFNAGDVGDSAYIIIDGTVEISVPTPSGPIIINNMQQIKERLSKLVDSKYRPALEIIMSHEMEGEFASRKKGVEDRSRRFRDAIEQIEHLANEMASVVGEAPA